MKARYNIITITVCLAGVVFAFTSSAETTNSHASAQTEYSAFLPLVRRPPDPLAGLVYSDDQGLWLVEENGNARFLIEYEYGTLSPDGSQVAYWFYQGDEGDNDIWLADLSTGERRNLTRSPDIVDRYPQWWPAREGIIIFGTNDEVRPSVGRLTTVDTGGNNYRVLDEQGYGPFGLSPDGQTIAYASYYGSTRTLYHWDGGSEILDPADYGIVGGNIVAPAWSPNGQYIAWEIHGYTDTDGKSKIGIAVFDLEAGTGTLLHLYESYGGGEPLPFLSWSPDGQWLAFVTWNEILETRNPEQGITGPTGGPIPCLWIIRADGQEEMYLGWGVHPVWSTEGQKLAYNRIAADKSDDGIWLVDVSSQEQRQVLPAGTTVRAWKNAKLLQNPKADR